MSTASKMSTRLLTILLSSKGNRLNLVWTPDWAHWHSDHSFVEAEISIWTRTKVGSHIYDQGLARGSVDTSLSDSSQSPSSGGSPLVCVYLPEPVIRRVSICACLSPGLQFLTLKIIGEKNPCAMGKEKKRVTWTYAQNILSFLTRSAHRKRLFCQSKQWVFLKAFRWSREIKPPSK